MASRKRLKILVMGGRGFVGDAVCKALRRHTVYTFDRHTGGPRHIQGNAMNVHHLSDAVTGKDVVINLLGISPARYHPDEVYQKVHVEAVRHLVMACKKNKIKHLVHMSALGSDPFSPYCYLRTKGKGEALVLDSGLRFTIFKPSLIIDKGNELVSQACRLSVTRFVPDIPALVQPILRTDIAELFALAVEKKIKQKILEVGGPETMSISALFCQIYRRLGRTCIRIPLWLFRPMLRLCSIFHLFGIGADQVKFLTHDTITSSKLAKKYIDFTSVSEWIKKTRF